MSEMKQLKKDQDESEKEHEKAFQEAIVSAQTLCGFVHRSGSVFMPLCYVVNLQETLEKYRRKAFIDKIKSPHPIGGPNGRCHFSLRMHANETQF